MIEKNCKNFKTKSWQRLDTAFAHLKTDHLVPLVVLCSTPLIPRENVVHAEYSVVVLLLK